MFIIKKLDFYIKTSKLTFLHILESKNIVNACKAARERKFSSIITLTGFAFNNPVMRKGDINFWVNSKVYNFIENTHQIILLSISDYIAKTKIEK